MTAALPRPATVGDDELLDALLHADPRPPRARLLDLDTVQLAAVPARYGDPACDELGTNRWDSPWSAWPWVKTRANRWVHTGWTEQAPRTNAEMTGCPRGRGPGRPA